MRPDGTFGTETHEDESPAPWPVDAAVGNETRRGVSASPSGSPSDSGEAEPGGSAGSQDAPVAPVAAPPRRCAVTHAPSRWHRVGDFIYRLWEKILEDEAFFMAGAVAFNIILAMIPLLVLAAGVTGFLLHAQVDQAVRSIVSLIQENLPQVSSSEGLTSIVQQITVGLVSQRTDLTVIGALVFVWLATRLVGTMRMVLREIFDIASHRGIIAGKLFDALVVTVGIIFLTLNLGATVTMEAAVTHGVRFLGLGGPSVGLADQVLGQAVAFASIWALFLVVYRYLPPRRIPWRTSLVAATFSAVLHESLKWATGWYFTGAADFTSTFGNLATVAVFILWIYWEATLFIVGGEVAQVYNMRKAARIQVRATIQGES